MAKITEYPQATKLDTGDVLLKDGTGGTKKMLATDLAKELAPDIVGDVEKRVDDLETAVEELNPIRDVNSANLWESGAIRTTSSKPETHPIGANVNSTTRIRTKSYLDSSILKISVDSSHKYVILAYTDTSDQYDESLGTAVFQGVWNGSAFGASDSSTNWHTEDTDVADLDAAAGAETYRYRLVLAENSDADITQAGYSGAQLMARGNAIEVDNTLTVEGMAADAKAAGDRISVLESQVGTRDLNDVSLWRDGGLSSANGTNTSTSTRASTATAIPSGTQKIVNSDPAKYQYAVFVYDGFGASLSSYLGIYNPSTGAISPSESGWTTKDINISDVIAAASSNGVGYTGEYSFKLLLKLVENTAISAKDGTAFQFIGTDSSRMEGIPILYLSSVTQEEAGEGANVNVNEMTKDEKITMRCSIFSKSDLCTVKWQGSSSIRYSKKNYTLTLKSTVMDAYKEWLKWLWDYRKSIGIAMSENNMPEFAGITDENTAWWGNQKKFCLKANFVDPSMARNIVSARLWTQMVKSRIDTGEITDKRTSAPKQGAIDGFPVEIRIDGESIGLYTFNIPKDEWTFDMGGENAGVEYLVGGEANGLTIAKFRGPIGNVEAYDASKTYSYGALTVYDDSLYQYRPSDSSTTTTGEWTEAGWDKIMDVEYASDGKTAVNALTSLDVVISKVAPLVTATPGTNPDSANWETILAPYLDIQSVYDYFIFTCCIGNNDALARNILYGNYNAKESDADTDHDGKWFMSAYDMDTTYGHDPYGTDRWTAQGTRTNFAGAANMHGLAWLVYHFGKEHLVTRYKQLREGYYEKDNLDNIVKDANGYPIWHEAILSDANVLHEFSWFVTNIPERDYTINQEIWPELPGTATADITNFVEYYRNHCAYLDREIAEIEQEADVGN